MFTEMNPLLTHQGREDMARGVRAGRLERQLREGPRPRRGRRWAFGLAGKSGASPGVRTDGGLRPNRI